MTEHLSNMSFMKSCRLGMGVLNKWDHIYICAIYAKDRVWNSCTKQLLFTGLPRFRNTTFGFWLSFLPSSAIFWVYSGAILSNFRYLKNIDNVSLVFAVQSQKNLKQKWKNSFRTQSKATEIAGKAPIDYSGAWIRLSSPDPVRKQNNLIQGWLTWAWEEARIF